MKNTFFKKLLSHPKLMKFQENNISCPLKKEMHKPDNMNNPFGKYLEQEWSKNGFKDKLKWLKIELPDEIPNDPYIETIEVFDRKKMEKIYHFYDAIKWVDDDGKDYTSKETKRTNIQLMEKILKQTEENEEDQHICRFYKDKGVGRHQVFNTKYPSASHLTKSIRFLVMGDKVIDCDFRASHPSISRRIFESLDLQCPFLDQYINDKKAIAEKVGMKLEEFKEHCNAMLYGGSYKHHALNDWLKNFYYEANFVYECCWRLNGYKLYNYLESKGLDTDDEKNPQCQVASYVAQEFEDRCLMILKEEVEKINFQVCSYCYDGLMVQKQGKDDEIRLQQAFEMAEMKIKMKLGFDMKIVIKPMETAVKIPKTTYNVMKYKYENNLKLCYIQNEKKYAKQIIRWKNKKGKLSKEKQNDDDKGIVAWQKYTKEELLNDDQTKFKQLDKKGNIEKKQFLKVWCNDENRQEFMSCGMKPPGLDVDIELNCWEGFYLQEAADKLKLKDCQEIFEYYKKFISYLISEEGDALEWFLDTQASLIQNPGQKLGVCNIIKSKCQGVGKGTLKEILFKLLRNKNTFVDNVISCSYEYLFGAFNEIKSEKLLIIVDESEGRDQIKYQGKMKEAVSDSQFTNNGKNKTMKTDYGYEKYYIFSNKTHPIFFESGSNNRRWAVFEHQGTKQMSSKYRNELVDKLINNEDNLCKLFKALKERKITHTLNYPPETKARIFHTNYAQPQIERFLEHLLEVFGAEGKQDFRNMEFYQRYREFCIDSGCEKDKISTQRNFTPTMVEYGDKYGFIKQQRTTSRKWIVDFELLGKWFYKNNPHLNPESNIKLDTLDTLDTSDNLGDIQNNTIEVKENPNKKPNGNRRKIPKMFSKLVSESKSED